MPSDPLATTETLEVVYYATPIPSGPAALTYLGLVFDRVHFPNVYLPTGGYDPEAVAREAKRIADLGLRDRETAILVGTLNFLPYVEKLRDLCHFTGVEGQVFGGDLKEAGLVVTALDTAIFGPPPPGFNPTHSTGFHKALPENSGYIDYPGNLHYPANALVYAAQHGLPLINDDQGLPVPGLGGAEAKDNAKLLSTLLAMECVRVLLPSIRTLSVDELNEARDELRKYAAPFRRTVLRLSAELNRNISAGASNHDIIRAAQFIVETEVLPSLRDLNDAIEKPKGRWLDRAVDTAKQVPELATAYATMPLEVAIAKTLGAVSNVLVDVRAQEAKQSAARTGMYYLLRMRDLQSRD